MMSEWPLLALDRLADQADYAIVGPTDGRTRVAQASAHPYAATCHIERDFGDGRLSGCSGFLVAPRIVLTAGHCVFSRARHLLLRRGAPARIRVSPGRNGEVPPFGFQWASHWFVDRRFAEHGNPMFDFGIIVLSRPFGGVRRQHPIAALSDAQFNEVRSHRLLHIAGYPADKPPGTMWEHAERLDRIGARTIHYSVDTCPGHSGSPVWVRSADSIAVKTVAIHVAGPRPHENGPWGCRPGVPVAPAGSVNRGIRLLPLHEAMIRRVQRGASHPDLRRFPKR